MTDRPDEPTIEATRRFKRFALGILLLVALAATEGCYIETDPVAPSWDTQLQLQLLNRVYDMQYFINKEDSSVLDYEKETGIVYYLDTTIIAPHRITEPNLRFKVNDSSVNYNEVGDIDLGEVENVDVKVPLTDWHFGATPGSFMVVPEQEPTLVRKPLKEIDAWESATFSDGIVDLIVKNQNGDFDITVAGIVLRNANMVPAYTNNETRVVPYRDSTVYEVPLDDMTVGKQLFVDLKLGTPGSDGAVQVPGDAHTHVVYSMREGYVLETVVAVLPEQDEVTTLDDVTIDDSTFFTQVTIRGGALSIQLDNGIDLPVRTTITMPELLEPDYRVFERTTVVERKSSATVEVNELAGWRMRSPIGEPFASELAYTITHTPISDGEVSVVNRTDTFKTAVYFQFLGADYFKGIVKPTELNITTTKVPLKLGDLEDHLTFDAVKMFGSNMRFEGFQTSGFNIAFVGDLVGDNGREVRTIPIDTILAPDRMTVIVGPKRMEDYLSSFTGAFPDDLVLQDIEATLNPPAFYEEMIAAKTTAEAEVDDSASGYAVMDIPFHFGILNGEFFDTAAVEGGGADGVEDVQRAFLVANLTNAMPNTVKFYGELVDANGERLMYVPPLDTLTLIELATPEPGADGFIVEPVETEKRYELTNEQFRRIPEAKEVRVHVFFNTLENPPETGVKYRNTDGVFLRIYGDIVYRINSE